MRYFKILMLFVLGISTNALAQNKSIRTVISFDKNWKFIQQDAVGADKVAFDDSKWRQLDVPHDWSIEGNYDKLNTSGRGGGYLPTGIGWYRKTFTLSATLKNTKVSVEFDGVMANSEVWINGHYLGKRPFGYISFAYDLSKYLQFGEGKNNVIAVKADNTLQPASRYYAGAGIYRHVRIVAKNPVHIAQWGVFVYANNVTAQKANINANIEVNNQTDKTAAVTVETAIIDATGKQVKTINTKTTLNAGKTKVLKQETVLDNPILWDVTNPNLYKAITKVTVNGKLVDQEENTFGIRDAKFEAATGFWLNGKNIKIKGVCLHHDVGALGAAVPLKAWERRFNLLKEVGVNAIRVGHNPMAPEFLDLCDRMGFLVMNETFDTWTARKNNGENGYNLYFKDWWEKDTRDLVLRDRNHASVIVYSVGNEIRDNLDSEEGFKKYKDQQDLIHSLDPTRPVTMALFRPSASKVYTNGFAKTMDIVGQNYREAELVAFHEANPETIALGTENGHTLPAWLILRDKPYMSGQFLWTGFNYLGEADWPEIANNQGLFDHSGKWRPEGLQRQSWWSDKPVVHIVRKEENAGAGNWVANWTPTDFDTYDVAQVQVYSNCDEVEVFLNDVSQGTKKKPKNDAARNWELTFEKGTLKAVGRNKGKEVSSQTFTTAGEPDRIVLAVSEGVNTDKAVVGNTWDDVLYITASVVDKNGVVCPNATQLINFKITDNGEIAGVENGNITSHEAYKATKRHVYKGSNHAIIKAKAKSGEITLTASAEGLKTADIKITIK